MLLLRYGWSSFRGCFTLEAFRHDSIFLSRNRGVLKQQNSSSNVEASASLPRSLPTLSLIHI